MGGGGAGGGLWAWRSGRRDGRPTGGSSAGPTAVPAPTAADGAPAPLWQEKAFDREQRTTPLVADGVVGFAETTEFRALDMRDGSELWAESAVMEPRQITTDGTVFYLSSGEFEGPGVLHLRTRGALGGGGTSRTIDLKGFEGSYKGTELLTASDGVLFASSRRGDWDVSGDRDDTGWHLIAVDVRAGRELWRQPYAWDGVRPWLSKVVGDRLLLGKNSGDLDSFLVQARDLRTGRQLWRRRLPLKDSASYIPGQLVTDERHVYLGGDRLRALRLTDGAVVWEYGSGSASTSYGVPAVANGLVHAQERRETPGLVSVGAGNGRRHRTEGPSGRSLSPYLFATPVVGEKYVYTPVRGGLNAVALDGYRSDWVFRTEASRFVTDKERTRLFGAGQTSVVSLPLA
ncbi:PQQ-binding-like beta-propeller repeat protein [Streptomyces sp. NPDC057242]|uniref:outer membrane protein assembly factor BamB family protein n=1 Tax=Streptomyces sp. NPDC057242 TaxID=3346063 RepID=UPI003638454F